VPLDFAAARELLEAAAARGLKEAAYTLAGFDAYGFGALPDFARAWHFLLAAGRSGHVPAWRTAGILLTSQPDYAEYARNLLTAAACAGDVLAQAGLAEYLRRLDDAGCAAEAAYWNALAATRNVPSAVRRATGESSVPQAPDINAHAIEKLPWTTLEQRDPPAIVAPGAVRQVVQDVLYVADAVLPPLIRDYLMNIAGPRLKPSGVVDPDTGNLVHNPIRSSYSMYFSPSMYDVVVACASQAVAGLAGVHMANAEPLTILRYGPGQEYKAHMDYLVGPATGEQMQRTGGQRLVTAFVYLNDVEEGGETDFPELGARVSPVGGRAVKFFNLTPGREPNPRTRHAGCPVLKGEKWLATYWFRERAFTWR
jgi:TPR repeat protein